MKYTKVDNIDTIADQAIPVGPCNVASPSASHVVDATVAANKKMKRKNKNLYMAYEFCANKNCSEFVPARQELANYLYLKFQFLYGAIIGSKIFAFRLYFV